jgi:hypothetical protein
MGFRPAERTARFCWKEYAEWGQKVYGNSEIGKRMKWVEEKREENLASSKSRFLRLRVEEDSPGA